MEDMAGAAVQGQTDGALYYKISEGHDEMPSFKKKNPETEDCGQWLIISERSPHLSRIPYKLKTHNMKIALITLFSVFIISATYAQTSDAEAEAIVNLLGVQKREAVAQLVAVSDKDSVAFWKIYGEYEKMTKSTAKLRIKLYEKTAMSYSNMTPQRADSLAVKYFTNRQEQEKSLETYYQKIKTATNPIIAFQFYQAEAYLLTQIRAQIMHQIPTYGQLVSAAPKRK